MTIRAGASDPEMAQSLGINIRWLHALVFAPVSRWRRLRA